MQNGFVKCDSTIKVAKKIGELLKANVFDSIVATRFLNGNNSIYEKLFEWKKLKEDNETAIISGITPYIDYIFDKYIYSYVDTNFIQKLC